MLCVALPRHIAAAVAKSSRCARDHVHTDIPTRADALSQVRGLAVAERHIHAGNH